MTNVVLLFIASSMTYRQEYSSCEREIGLFRLATPRCIIIKSKQGSVFINTKPILAFGFCVL